MINANELRLGNFVKDRGGKVIRIDFLEHIQNGYDTKFGQLIFLEGNEVHPMTEYTDYAEPIPLTEEWLLKFGFENWGTIVCNQYEKYQRWVLYNIIEGTSNFEVHIIESTYGGSNDKEICYSIDQDQRQWVQNTEFVHNLQNSYFLCTKQELTINQP